MSIQVENLQFSYQDINVLKGITYHFQEGLFYGIVGPNGSGKTTLLKLITRLLEVERSKILINSEDITTYKPKRLAGHIAYVPQIFNMEYSFSVYDVVAMGRYPYLKGFNDLSQEDEAAIENALIQTNLLSYRNRMVNTLSGGELQRVVLARAIAQETRYILLDEPLSHLDIHHQLEILNLSKKLCEQGKTIICVLHDLNLTMKYCDQTLLLHQGHIVAHGKTEEVLTPEYLKLVYQIQVTIQEVMGQKIIIY